MTGYATSSCSNMDSVWRILKLNVDKQVGPIFPNAMGKLSQQSFVICWSANHVTDIFQGKPFQQSYVCPPLIVHHDF